jgi:hypothetical protein
VLEEGGMIRIDKKIPPTGGIPKILYSMSEPSATSHEKP